jgi:hypothetical protein
MFLDHPRRRRRQALSRIEASLVRSDPGLAGRFQRFNEWARYEERLDRRPVVRAVIVVVIMTVIAVLMIACAMTESGGLGGGSGPGLTASASLDAEGMAAQVMGLPASFRARPGVRRPAPASWWPARPAPGPR